MSLITDQFKKIDHFLTVISAKSLEGNPNIVYLMQSGCTKAVGTQVNQTTADEV